jgi:hypothetical protein
MHAGGFVVDAVTRGEPPQVIVIGLKEGTGYSAF